MSDFDPTNQSGADTGESTDVHRSYQRWRLQIFSITWLAYVGFYLTRKSFAVAKVEMGVESSIGLTKIDMGWIDSGYLTAYAVGQFVWGMLGDRFGPRKVVLGGMFASVIAGVLMGLSTVGILIGLFALIQGLCQSTGWAPLTKNVGNFFSRRERGWVMGFWCTNFAVGGFIASIYAGWAGKHFQDYRYAFFVPAATLFFIGLLFLLLQRNRPEDVGLPSIEEYHDEPQEVLDERETPEEEQEGSWKVVSEVLATPMVWLYAAVYFFLKPTRYAILFWGPLYLHEKLGTGMAESAGLSALFELAGPLGVLLGGLASDKIFGSRRNPVAVICLFCLAVPLFFLDDLPAERLWLGGCFFLIGFLLYAPDSLISGTAALDFGTKKGASTAVGIINGCGSVGAIVGASLPGFFQEQWGWGYLFNIYACASILAGLLLLPKWNAVPHTVADKDPANA